MMETLPQHGDLDQINVPQVCSLSTTETVLYISCSKRQPLLTKAMFATKEAEFFKSQQNYFDWNMADIVALQKKASRILNMT